MFSYHCAPTLGFSFVKEVFFAQKISVDPIHHLQRLLLFEQKGASFVQNRGFLFVLLCLLKYAEYNSHFLQTKFLSHKKIIEIDWRSLHPSLPFFTVKEDFFAQNFLPIPQPSPSLPYDPKHSKNRFFRAKKATSLTKRSFFLQQVKILSGKNSERIYFPAWKKLFSRVKESSLSDERNCFVPWKKLFFYIYK